MATYSTITCPATDIGSTMRIKINKADSSYWHTLSYTFGQYSGDITTGTSANTFDWVVPTGFYTEMPNDKTSTGIMTCVTYNSNTEIVGTYEETFTVRCNEEKCRPILNPTVKDTAWSVLTGDENKFIRYKSDAEFTVGATAQNSATIVSQRMECGSRAISAASGTMEGVDSATFVFVATDSRGFTTRTTLERTLIEYFEPTVNVSTSVMDANGNLTIKVNGSFFNENFGDYANWLSISYSYKQEGDSEYSDWVRIEKIEDNTLGNTYNSSVTISGLMYGWAYTVRARVMDGISDVTSRVETIVSEPVFNWGKDDFHFSVPVHVRNLYRTVDGEQHEFLRCGTSGDVYINSDSSTNSTGDTTIEGQNIELESGGTLSLTTNGDSNIGLYQTANDAELYFKGSDGSLIATAPDIYLDTDGICDIWATNGVVVNGIDLEFSYGTWTPNAYGCSRKTGKGQYIRFGEYCVVSFYYEGTVSSADDMFTIYNLPYASDGSRWWGGGGNISGAYANQNYVFCGWTMHDDGDIYARTAALSQSDGQNVGSNYLGQNTGQTIIASGTLMYRIDASEI